MRKREDALGGTTFEENVCSTSGVRQAVPRECMHAALRADSRT